MPTPALWTRDHARHFRSDASSAPRIGADDVVVLKEDLRVWDAWPIQQRDGSPLLMDDGAELWMTLAAPYDDDPDKRHDLARIYLIERNGDRWTDLGPAMPDGFAPGSREWSGSAVASADGQSVILHFTASGRRGEHVVTFEQRLFSAEASLRKTPEGWRLADWRGLRETVAIDPQVYMPTTGIGGAPGKIKAFRDPAFFHDPGDGGDYLFFAGSAADSTSDYNGVIGVAKASQTASSGWELLPPIISADGLNNELERPHVIMHGGLYYLFWSTQRHVFDPAGPTGPTGLYGMVSPTLLSGWKPLNETGLVFQNPVASPAQAYAWWVLPDLSVTGFVDDWGDAPGRRFGGSFAPFVHLKLDGDKAWLAD